MAANVWYTKRFVKNVFSIFLLLWPIKPFPEVFFYHRYTGAKRPTQRIYNISEMKVEILLVYSLLVLFDYLQPQRGLVHLDSVAAFMTTVTCFCVFFSFVYFQSPVSSYDSLRTINKSLEYSFSTRYSFLLTLVKAISTNINTLVKLQFYNGIK